MLLPPYFRLRPVWRIRDIDGVGIAGAGPLPPEIRRVIDRVLDRMPSPEAAGIRGWQWGADWLFGFTTLRQAARLLAPREWRALYEYGIAVWRMSTRHILCGQEQCVFQPAGSRQEGELVPLDDVLRVRRTRG